MSSSHFTPIPTAEITRHANEIKDLCKLIAGITSELQNDSPQARFFQLARLFTLADKLLIIAMQIDARLPEGESPHAR